MYIIKLLFISIINVVRVLYLPIASAHSIILYLLLITDNPFEDVEYYLHLFKRINKRFYKVE